MNSTLSNQVIEVLLDRLVPEVESDGIKGKSFLVTGAGGTIGSQLVRQLVEAGAKKVVLVEHSEYALYTAYTNPEVMVPRLMSYGDARITDLLEAYAIDCVIHAGAYKHVPLVELNPVEGVKNNVLEFARLVDYIERASLDIELVVISTDKAVRPSNVMGATKAMVESIAINCKLTTVSVVRFGNVLGSSGSVLPLFERQLSEGKPLTVTHEDVTRYFMSVKEACSLVLASRGMGRGVKVLDMGSPVRILDLAERFLHMKGSDDHPIEIIGLRAGEKLHEELYVDSQLEKTAKPRILEDRAAVRPVKTTRINRMCRQNDLLGLRQELQRQIRSYTPACPIVDPIFTHTAQVLAATGFEDCYRTPSPEKL